MNEQFRALRATLDDPLYTPPPGTAGFAEEMPTPWVTIAIVVIGALAWATIAHYGWPALVVSFLGLTTARIRAGRRSSLRRLPFFIS